MKKSKTELYTGGNQFKLAYFFGIWLYLNSVIAFSMDEPARGSLNQKRIEVNFKLLVSSQLSSHLLNTILTQEGESYQEIIIQGLNPGQMLQESLAFWYSQIAGTAFIPRISIDPKIFKDHEITQVPTLFALVGDHVIAKVTGIIHVEWLIERLKVDFDVHINGKQKIEIIVDERSLPYPMRDYGIQGPTVKISEKNLLTLIEESIREVNWLELRDKSFSLFWHSYPFRKLKKADECQVFQLSAETTLTQPLLNEKGEVLIASGHRFDPFDFLPFLQTLIVFNGNDNNEIDSIIEFIQNTHFTNHQLTLIVSELETKDPKASLNNLQKRFNRPIYILNSLIEERFQIKYTPTLITSKENKFEIYSGCLSQK